MNASKEKQSATLPAAHARPWWLEHAFGWQLLAWQQAQCDAAVADIFGYHAVQLGGAGLDALRANRMPWRWVAHMELEARPRPKSTFELVGLKRPGGVESSSDAPAPALICHPCALPLATSSVDLLVGSHILDGCPDVPALLAEVARVLAAEGRVLILGFNPTSLWAVAHRLQRASAPHAAGALTVPQLRQQLHALGLVVEQVHFSGHGWPARTPGALRRWRWLDALGARLWPALGGAYCLQAVKRQCTPYTISGAAWQATPAAAATTAGAVAGRQSVLKKQP